VTSMSGLANSTSAFFGCAERKGRALIMNGSNRIALFGFILGLALAGGCSGERASEDTAPEQESVSNVRILAERLEGSIAEAEALQKEMIGTRQALSQSLGALQAKISEAEKELGALEASIGASEAALGKLRGDLNELVTITAGPQAAEAIEAEDESSGAARALGIVLAVLIIAGVCYAVIMIRNRSEDSEPGTFGAKWGAASADKGGKPTSEKQSEFGSIRFFAGQDSDAKNETKDNG
jgi:hypothetical protein